jgi:TetR/AcrR family transcriptional regulator, transcriptional repressor for nem operon
MRYPPEHKAEIHQSIVKDASRLIRTEGITGAAVTAVMRDAGLTHGGFYKHFASKDDLLVQALSQAFEDIADRLTHAAGQSGREPAWKAIVKTYLSLEYCDHVEYGCPLPALAPELARAGETIKPHAFKDLKNYKARMLPFMPGLRTVDKERAFFSIFSTMVGAMEIARILPEKAMQEKVLRTAREFLLRSF